MTIEKQQFKKMYLLLKRGMKKEYNIPRIQQVFWGSHYCGIDSRKCKKTSFMIFFRVHPPKKQSPPGWTSNMWVFPKIRVPQNGWFIMDNPTLLKWMIWGYHYFRIHPCLGLGIPNDLLQPQGGTTKNCADAMPAPPLCSCR